MSVGTSLVTTFGGFTQGSYPEPYIDIAPYITGNSVTITLAPEFTQTANFIQATLQVTTDEDPVTPPTPPPPEKGYTDITPEEALLYLNPASCSYKPGAHLIDIRSEFERDYYGTPGDDGSGAYLFLDQVNVHIPFEFRYYKSFVGIPSEITDKRRRNPDFLPEMRRQFKKDDVLILICRTGGRTTEAAEKLAASGFTNIYNVLHGIEDPGGWKSNSLPINYNPQEFYTFRCLSCTTNRTFILLN